MKPHKHAELIKAWADGAEIEFFSTEFDWAPISNPAWNEATQYRIKPEKKWFRLAEFLSVNRLEKRIAVADCQEQEDEWRTFRDFNRWITDRIYYE